MEESRYAADAGTMQEKKEGAVISETHSAAQEGVGGDHGSCVEREQTIADEL